MKRKDKIKLLKDIAEGRKSVEQSFEDEKPQIITIWVQDEVDPNLYRCKEDGITMQKDELEKSRGYITIRIVNPNNPQNQS